MSKLTNAEKLQKEPDDALVKVIGEVVEHANLVGTDKYPYAYRFYDTGDKDVMLEVYAVMGDKQNNFELHIVDKTGRRVALGDPSANNS